MTANLRFSRLGVLRIVSVAFALLLCASTAMGQAQQGLSGTGHAGPADPPRTETQQNENNWTSPYPKPDSGYVTDLAGLLTLEQQEQLEQQLWDIEEQTGVEVAVVLIRSMSDYPGTADGSIESFARGLFDTYGIGNMPTNDGVLLLVSRNDRAARIELGAGHGRARDRDAERIMQGTIIPRFKQNDYDGGVRQGTRAIIDVFALGQPVSRAHPGSGARNNAGGGSLVFLQVVVGILLIPVFTAVAYSLFKNGNRGWGWLVVGLLVIVILGVLRGLLVLFRNIQFSSGGGGGSSGWSSGGFGGGFGGGSSGGGGASGSW